MADETAQAAPAPKRGSLVQAFLMIAALAASCAVGGYYLWVGSRSNARMSDTGFDVAHVDAPAPTAATYAAPAAPKASPMPIAGLAGMSTSAQPESQSQGGTFQRTAPGPAAEPGAAGPSEADRAHEKEFLAKHGAELNAYQNRVLNNIAMKHYRNDPVVRRVDAEFARLPHYMALKRQFDKDHDPFTFARGALALPEVRNQIAKSVADPGVWKAALGMISEALKSPPPKTIYDEAKRFMTKEEAVTNYMANDFMPLARQNQAAISGAMGPDTDVSGLMKLAQDIGPAGTMPSMPGGLNPAALGAMGQPPSR